jgi:hypothetical protein
MSRTRLRATFVIAILSMAILLSGINLGHYAFGQSKTIMTIINLTPPTVFLAAFIMTFTKNDFGIETLTKIPANHIEL